jgi:hypothetical protein
MENQQSTPVWTLYNKTLGQGPTSFFPSDVVAEMTDENGYCEVPEAERGQLESTLASMQIGSTHNWGNWRIKHHSMTEEELENAGEWQGF